jgi:ferrous iron transporter FeoB
VFALTMAALFSAIFMVASVPMDLIDLVFGRAAEAVRSAMPEGLLADLIADGIVAGIGGVVIFLPQICLLFFLLSLLEDSGYLARAAFAVDRVMRRFGLSGPSFVPLLSSHACALPGIMSTRLIRDDRERLATILVAPFMSCSARLPVYVLLIGILSVGKPAWFAGAAFVACYALGAVAGLLTALLARRTVLRGPARPLVMELPPYRVPALRNALLVTWDRALVFLRNAGTTILAISVVMWWLSAFPRNDGADARAQQAGSFAGQLGVRTRERSRRAASRDSSARQSRPRSRPSASTASSPWACSPASSRARCSSARWACLRARAATPIRRTAPSSSRSRPCRARTARRCSTPPRRPPRWSSSSSRCSAFPRSRSRAGRRVLGSGPRSNSGG